MPTLSAHGLVILIAWSLTIAAMGAEDIAAQPVRPTVSDHSLDAYVLDWSDEFADGKLDMGKWDYRTDSKHWSTQKPENVSLANGSLLLHLKKEEAGGKHYTGGGLISKRTFRYGFYEARMRTPPGAGWHTSFWMMLQDGKGGTVPNLACQELDVIENDSVNPDKYAVNVHKWKGDHVNFGGKSVKTPGLAEKFHTFGCEFTATTVKYFCDGNLVQTVDVTSAKKNGQAVPFEHGDQHIWLTSIASQLGGAKEVDDSKLPATAEFEYVRFFVTKDDKK